jgi:hypothetical protein
MPRLPAVEAAADLPVLRLAMRLRWIYFILIAILLVAGYNGQWRIGRDSALHRSVAQSISAGEGYKYRGERETHIYQGLPRLLAGVDAIFGPQDPLRPAAAQAVMLGMALLTLLVVYHMLRVRYPRWVAVCVTTGVGINPYFAQYSHELMTDVPFLLGVCLVLLGIAKLGRYQARRWGLWGAVAIIGAVLAISMRPTFVPLAAAFALTCIVGVVRSRRWLWYVAGIAVLGLLLVGFWQLDPRHEGNILEGRYEEIALSHARQIGSPEWMRRLGRTVNHHLPEALFGIELVPPFGAMLVLAAFAGAIHMMRRDLLWGLCVLCTLALFLALGSVPRYFLMILPLLLAQWAELAAMAGTALQRWRYLSAAAVLGILGVATIANAIKSVDVVREQRGWTRTFEKKPFQEVCKHGRMLHIIKLAEQIRRAVPPGQKVLGPEPRILTFLSGRNVYHPSELQPPKHNAGWTRMLERRGVTWCIFGPRFSSDRQQPDGRIGHHRMNFLVENRLIAIDRSSLVRLEGMYLVRIISEQEHRIRLEQARAQNRLNRLEARRAGKVPLTPPPATAPAKEPGPATPPATAPSPAPTTPTLTEPLSGPG